VIDCVPFIFSGDRCEQFRRRKRSGIGQGFYLCCWDSYIDEVEEVQGQISQGKPSFDL
jgi:hypothetical protein